MAKPLSITVDTGIETVEIKDATGLLLGSFRFNPADSNIFKRHDAVVEFLNNISFDEGSEDAPAEEINKLADTIGQQFDYLLGFDVAEDIFGKCGALTALPDGDLYFEKVIQGIGDLMESTFNKRLDKKIAKARKKAEKYKK